MPLRRLPAVLGLYLCLVSVFGWARTDGATDPKAAIQQLIVAAEAEGSRDLSKAEALAKQASDQAEALGDAALATYAQLTWADALLKARKLDEADTLLKRIRKGVSYGADARTDARLTVLEARWLRDNNRIDEAETAFLRAAELANKAADEQVLANVLNSHSAMLWRHGQVERAVVMLDQALKINLKLGREGDANKNRSYLALIARDRGDFDLARRLNDDVLASSERLGDLRGIAVSANSIGLLLSHQDEFNTSLDYFRRAAAAYREVGERGGEGPALSNVGQSLIELGRLDEAEPPLREALAMAKASADPLAEVLARSHLANLALKRGQFAEAEREALAAVALAEKLPARSASASAYSALAEIRREQKRPQEAIAFGRQALIFAREQGRLYDMREILTSLAEDLANNGQFQEAYTLQQETSEVGKQIRDREVQREVARIENAYEAHQREAALAAQAQRISLLEQQAEQQRSMRYLLAVALVASVLLMVALISRALIKRRSEHQLREQNVAIERANRELAEAAGTDVLTRARNRRYFHLQSLPMLQARAANGEPFTLVLIDADHFKAINDTYGHDVGDQALIAIAQAWRDVLGADDTLLRWGGEEFLVVSGCDDHAADELVARGLAATRRMRLATHPDLTMTVSIGAVTGPWTGADIPTLLQIADRAMLMAKREGRDRAISVRHEGELRLSGGVIPEDLADVAGVILRRTH